VVLVEDECRVARESDVKAVWHQKGERPLVKYDNTKEGKSFYGALNVKTGECHSRRIEGNQVSERTVEFLEQLEETYAGKRVLLIWDGAPWHRGRVKEYLARKGRKCWLEIMYFPPYSPDMNPQEQVWKRTKQNTTHNSEKTFEDKLDDFENFLCNNTFNTDFLAKYS
jgi:transposase